MQKISESQRRELLDKFDFDDYSRQPVSFYFCQAGYDGAAYKPVIVWTTAMHPRAAAHWRADAGGEDVKMPIEDLGFNRWGRREWRVDLSQVNQPGAGRVKVDFDGLAAESPPIVIRAHGYQRLMKKAAAHYHYKQCGVTCHRHDGYLYSLASENFGEIAGHVPAHGGWHDAHDDNKWLVLTWMAVHGLLKAHEHFAARGSEYKADREYCLAEAKWEIEWLLRMQKPDGSFYHAVWEWAPAELNGKKILRVWSPPHYDDLCDDRRALVDCWGQNVAGRLIGVTTVKTPSTAPKYFTAVAHNLLHFARLADGQSGYKGVGRRCLAAAERTLAYIEKLPEIAPYQALEVDALLALCRLERFRLLHDADDLRACESRIQAILAKQQPEGLFHSSANCRGLEWHPEEAGDERVFVDYPFGYILALTEYLDSSRAAGAEFRLIQPARDALGRFAELLAGLCRHTGFNQMCEPCVGRKPEIILSIEKTGHGYNPLILAAGTVLAAAGRLLGRAEWIRLAECQLYWVLGYNPRFMSFMNGEGMRNSGTYAAYKLDDARGLRLTAFYRHPRDLRWGLTTGIYAGPHPDYPMAGKSTEGQYDSKAQETWLNASGWFLRLLAELA